MVARPLRLDGLEIPQLIKQLDTDGVVCLDDAVDADWLAAVAAAVPHHIAAHGDGDFIVLDVGDQPDTPAWQLVNDDALRSLFAALGAASHPRAGDLTRLRSGLTVRAGMSNKGPGNLFHYDACVVNMVIPILIPEGEVGTCGDLVTVANKRPFRRSLAAHAFDKLRTHNPAYRRRVARAALREPSKYVTPLKPGSAYLFWGYRTLHGNFPCAPGFKRVTLLLHFGEVHRGSAALDLARVWSRWHLRAVTSSTPSSTDGRPLTV